jgi:N-terminal domain of galactosyltransferase
MITQQYSLKHTEIIMTFRAATPERTDNLFTVLRHLKANYTDYTVRLMEADTAQQLQTVQLAGLNVEHHFIFHRGAFPKAFLCNLGVLLASSPVICIHDADSVAMPLAVTQAVSTLLPGSTLNPTQIDVICPYLEVINIQASLKAQFIESLDYDVVAKATVPSAHANVLYHSANGGIVFFKRDQYIKVGGYNHFIVGWGGEDDELFARCGRLGFHWVNLSARLLHLHHDANHRDAQKAIAVNAQNHVQSHFSINCSDQELADLNTQLCKLFKDRDDLNHARLSFLFKK